MDDKEDESLVDGGLELVAIKKCTHQAAFDVEDFNWEPIKESHESS